MEIKFYRTADPYGCFSNFARYGFALDGVQWKTSEHYFQAQKFADADYAEKIRMAPSAKDAAVLGRSRRSPLRADWEAIKDDVMHRAVRAKFEQNSEIRQTLLQTEDAVIIENSAGDSYWGCGADGSGRNQLGKILMEVRSELRCREKDKREMAQSRAGGECV